MLIGLHIYALLRWFELTVLTKKIGLHIACLTKSLVAISYLTQKFSQEPMWQHFAKNPDRNTSVLFSTQDLPKNTHLSMNTLFTCHLTSPFSDLFLWIYDCSTPHDSPIWILTEWDCRKQRSDWMLRNTSMPKSNVSEWRSSHPLVQYLKQKFN